MTLCPGSLMSFPDNSVTDEENVFRGIINVAGMLDRYGNPATGCLKQSNGVSVDRDGNRSDEDVIQFMVSKRLSNRAPFIKFLKMNVGMLRRNEWDVDAKPVIDDENPDLNNPYHAEMKEVHPAKHLNQTNAAAILGAGQVFDVK